LHSSPLSAFKDNQLVKGVTDNATNSLVTGRMIAVLIGARRPVGSGFTASTGTAPFGVGGEHFTVRRQRSRRPRTAAAKRQAGRGLAVDNDHINQGSARQVFRATRDCLFATGS
jgi:hypothetical protein